MCVATKNLAIRETVYRKLAEEKRQGESFSDVIERMLEKRASLLPLWGALADSKSIARIQDDIARIRRRAKVRV
jgi:predicted CopG family antitoxin